MSSLAELRAKLQAQESRSQKNAQSAQSGGDNSIYPFWNLTEGQTSTVRFLPDGDRSNVYFWVERNMIRLPFPGVKGHDESKQVVVQVPCMEMYGPNDKCPILAEVRTWYKDKSLEEMANKYWKKRTYIYQGFVRQDGLNETSQPENPIRRFVFKSQIHKIIKSSLLDPEFDIMPTSYDNGLDFKIISTVNGKWNEYVTSTWARRESALTDVERAAIEAHGLYDLKEFLPKKPSESELRIIKEMFEASVDGRLYDPDRWAAYYKPWGLQVAGAAPDSDVDEDDAPRVSYKPVAKTVIKPRVEEGSDDTEPVNKGTSSSTPPWEDESEAAATEPVVVAQKPTSDKAKDILDLIRSKQLKKS